MQIWLFSVWNALYSNLILWYIKAQDSLWPPFQAPLSSSKTLFSMFKNAVQHGLLCLTYDFKFSEEDLETLLNNKITN